MEFGRFSKQKSPWTEIIVRNFFEKRRENILSIYILKLRKLMLHKIWSLYTCGPIPCFNEVYQTKKINYPMRVELLFTVSNWLNVNSTICLHIPYATWFTIGGSNKSFDRSNRTLATTTATGEVTTTVATEPTSAKSWILQFYWI